MANACLISRSDDLGRLKAITDIFIKLQELKDTSNPKPNNSYYELNDILHHQSRIIHKVLEYATELFKTYSCFIDYKKFKRLASNFMNTIAEFQTITDNNIKAILTEIEHNRNDEQEHSMNNDNSEDPPTPGDLSDSSDFDNDRFNYYEEKHEKTKEKLLQAHTMTTTNEEENNQEKQIHDQDSDSNGSSSSRNEMQETQKKKTENSKKSSVTTNRKPNLEEDSIKYKCPLTNCPKNYERYNALTKHLKNKHSQDNFCTDCDRSFKSWKNLLKHYKNYHKADQAN